jgi:CRISPR/Cas system CSM-associated protein Csm5 (group 7 of RAMP superfamily)
VSDLFIASGQVAKWCDYILQQNKIFFIDDIKLFALLQKHNLEDSFANFILMASDNNFRNEDKNILKWLENNKVNVDEVQSCVKQSSIIKNGDSKIQEILIFMQNGKGEKYIPGSSVKGFLKACFDEDISTSEKISVSDSNIIANNNFEIAKTSYLNVKTGKTSEGKLPFYAEFLKPNVEISFVIKIPFSKEEFKGKIAEFNRNYTEKYLSAFSNIKDVGFDIFRLGRFTNIAVKTEQYQKNNRNTAKENIAKELDRFYRNKTNPHKNAVVAPICLKYISANEIIENGICTYQLEEIK